MDPISNSDLADKIDGTSRRVENLESKVEAIYTMLHKFEGMTNLVKFVFIALAPIWLCILWLKDHFKW